MKVAVCIITYRRANGLMRLLESIRALTFRGERPDIRLIVVDNDEEESARKTCEVVRPNLDCELRYYLEPRRGIPFARNTAIARAGDDVDCVAFIDDDEVPDPQWLDELLRVMQKYQADVVAGPVLSHFAEEPPAWVIEGKFYVRQRWSTGQILDRAFTGNILFRREVLSSMDGLFDERMAMTGGSDSHFSRRVHQAGYKIVWADEAVTTEWVPPTRVNARWILQRAYRIGTTTAFVELDIFPWPKAVTRVVLAGCLWFFKGTFLLPLGCVLGKRWMIRYARLICYGAGTLAGLLGARYQEYRRTHGG